VARSRNSVAVVAAVVAACGNSTSPPVAPVPTPAQGSNAGPALAASLVDCAALDGSDATAPGLGSGWTIAHRTLTRAPTSDSAATTIGVIADAGGAAPATLAALGRLRAQLDAAHVDVVLVLGGMASTPDDLTATWTALAANAGFPTIAIPGDLEPAAAHDAAIAAAQRQHLAVVDGRLVRWLELRGATVAILPGVGAAARHAAGGAGCGYTAAELHALVAALATRPALRILAAIESPRAWTAAGDPTGDLALPTEGRPDIVVHGAADTASTATTGGRDGSAALLSPGPADATPRLASHHPSAGVLVITGDRWTWRALADTPSAK
jgi:hypothetical protein